ncbi:MAG: hypothetical protein BMS9Abin28_2181 [Anaerolineae bacterium]|nr:MAG: hypothetical protein BMS9Abin28_2181 [Anaerolineae bacterium]
MDGIDWLSRLIPGILARPARYLDPGSGSYLLQLLIASALGAAFAVRLYWTRIKRYFSGIFGKSTDEDEENGDA